MNLKLMTLQLKNAAIDRYYKIAAEIHAVFDKENENGMKVRLF